MLLGSTAKPEELAALDHEAMAALGRARPQTLEIKMVRGYDKTEPTTRAPDERKARLEKLMAISPCKACGQYGHWAEDAPRPQ